MPKLTAVGKERVIQMLRRNIPQWNRWDVTVELCREDLAEILSKE